MAFRFPRFYASPSTIAAPVLRLPWLDRLAAWLKPDLHLPRTWGGLIKVVVAILVVGEVLFVGAELRAMGIFPVGGLSMESTIHQPLWLPLGPSEVQHRGAYVTIDRDRKPTEGSVVVFHRNGEEDIKRAEKVREDGALWVSSDNVGVTGRDSREYGWILPSEVVGVVTGIWTPRRMWRARTPEGRLENWAEFHYPPKKFVIANGIVTAVYDGKFYVYDGRTITDLGPAFDYASGAIRPIECRNGRFVYKPINLPHEYTVFDPAATGRARHYTFNALATLPDVIDGDSLNGITVVKPGGRVTFSRARRVDVDEQHEGHSVPTAQIDGQRVIECPMSTTILAQREVRNVGRSAFVVTPSVVTLAQRP